jgi:hypothetical protein
MYVGQAQELQEQGRYKEAEKLYISVTEPPTQFEIVSNCFR